jgi:charged multivesicular body protein 7
VARRDFIALADYQNAATSIYHRNWIPSLGEVLAWGWKQLGLGGVAAGAVPAGKWVLRENLEVHIHHLTDVEVLHTLIRKKQKAASVSLLKHLSETSTTPTSSIHTLTTLGASLPPHFSQSDIALLLTYLSRDRPHLTYKTLPSAPHETIIKFSIPPTAITESDISIANLKSLLLTLESQVPPLESTVSALDTAARTAITSNQTATARAALRRKKLAADALDKRRDNVFQLHAILARIDQAQDHVAMVRAMEASTAVLRHLNAQVGGVEAAERVSDALQEQMLTVEEIAGVVSEIGVGGAGAVDEADVEDEFAAMLGEERKKEDAAKEAKEAEKVRERWREVEALERKRAEAETGSGGKFTLPDVPDAVDVEAEVERQRKEVAGLHIDAAEKPSGEKPAREKEPALAS